MQLTSGMERLARFFPIIARGGFRELALYCTVLECVQYIYDLRPVSPFWRNYTGVLSHLDSIRFQTLLVSIRSQDKYLSCNLPPLRAFRHVLSMFISEWVSQSVRPGHTRQMINSFLRCFQRLEAKAWTPPPLVTNPVSGYHALKNPTE